MSFFFYFCAILKLQLILKDENDFDLGDELVACIWIKANLDLFASSKASRLLVKNPRSYLNC